ncbi:MAG: DNA-binding transcriptional regulator [Trueperaceae bacterium]|nr:DNA-binding transcriptional regulator [Trueperaceae bacterium]
MTKRAQRYGSDALAAVHETASELHAAGLLDEQTMRTFDALCLTPVEAFSAQQIVELRLREQASQAVFARYLNVTPSTVSQWERGEKRPRGPSLKLLTLVAKGGDRLKGHRVGGRPA